MPTLFTGLLLVKVTVLFIAALIALLTARRSGAAMRHLLCVCALAGSLVLPVAALFPAPIVTIRLPAIDAVAAAQAVARTQSPSASAVIFGMWAFGCVVLILRLAIGHWRIARLVRSATWVKPALYTADVSVPFVCGLFRPAVLMPRSSAEWPDWQFEAAVRHELMHVRRKDLWANFIAQLACAIYWFHPLVWIIANRLRDCQETACDDAVLFSGFEPATYAEALLAVARTSTPTLLPGCPMTTQTNLKTRITRLLDSGIARTTSRASLLRAATAFAIVLSAMAIMTPPKSSAQSKPPADKPDQIYKAGGDVVSPRVVYHVDPQYTEDARRDKISGTVLLSVVIGTDGRAHDVSILRSLDAGLDRNAVEVLEQWRFAPGTLNGEPVAVQATIEINYRLQ